MSALRELLAVFDIKVDTSQLEKGNAAVEDGISKLKAFGAALGASAIVVGIANMTRELANQAGALADQSQALGLSTKDLQEWQHAAKMSGVESGDLAASMMRVQKSAADAASGTGTAADAWKRLGINVKNADGSLKGTNQLFGEAAVALGEVSNSTDKTALSMDIFGKSGAKLIPLFNQGAEGIAQLRGEVDELGGGLGDTKGFEELGDNLDRWDLAFTSLKAVVGNFVLPLMNRLAIFAAKVAAGVSKLAKNSNILEAGFLVAGAAVAWFGRQSLIAGAKALLPFLPAIAIIGGIILLVDELITTFKGGDSLIRRAIDGMFGKGSTAKVVEWFKNVFSSVQDWFKKVVAAFSLIVNVFKDEGVEGLKRLFPQIGEAWWAVLDGIISAVKFVGGVIFDAFSGNFERIKGLGDFLIAAFDALALEVAAPLIEAAASIQDAFAGAWNAILSGAQATIKELVNAIKSIPGADRLVPLASNAMKGLEGAKLETNNAATAQQNLVAQRIGIAERFEASGRRVAGGSSNSTTTNAPVVNVTVPPGTSADTARRVGNAAAKGTRQGMRATKAALVQQGT